MDKRSNFIYDLDLSYDNNELQEELVGLDLEPYFKDNPNTDSWFAGPESWLYADVPDKPNTEIDSIRKQLKELLGTSDVVFAVMRQKANTSVPAHTDKLPQRILDMYPGTKPIQCAVNIQLNDPIGPIEFPKWGKLETYKCALLNIMEEHGVPAFQSDRHFIKFKILDVSYKEALNNYLKNKK
jgi:hypothetical protein